jgi:hypothetical protein
MSGKRTEVHCEFDLAPGLLGAAAVSGAMGCDERRVDENSTREADAPAQFQNILRL